MRGKRTARTHVRGSERVKDRQSFLHDVVRIDAQLLQQRGLVLKPLTRVVSPVRGWRLGVRYEHGAGVGRVLGHVASLVPSTTGVLTVATIVKLLEVLLRLLAGTVPVSLVVVGPVLLLPVTHHSLSRYLSISRLY